LELVGAEVEQTDVGGPIEDVRFYVSDIVVAQIEPTDKTDVQRAVDVDELIVRKVDQSDRV